MNKIISLVFVSLLLLSLFPCVQASPLAWYDDYENRVTLYINPSDIGETVFEFPLLLNISASSGKNTYDLTPVFDELSDNTDGLLITDSTQNPLYIEIDYWNATRESGAIWINAPFLSSSSDNFFYLYYDATKDGSAYQNASKVWNSDYVGVWHMNDNTTSTFLDSTVNNNYGDKGASGEPLESEVIIGKSQLFDGVDDWANIYRVLGEMSIDGGSITVLFNLTDSPDNFDRIVTNEGGATVRYYLGFHSNKLWYRLGGMADTYSDTTLTVGVYQVVLTWLNNSGTFEAQIYLNGQADDTLQSGYSLTGFATYLRVGAFDASNYNSPINVDEIRISTEEHSSSWVSADYLSLTDNLITIFGASSYVSDNMWALVALFIFIVALQVILIFKGGWLLNFFFGLITVSISIYYYDQVPSLPLGYLMPLILTFFSLCLFLSALLSRTEV